jgi:hypothetical protein
MLSDTGVKQEKCTAKQKLDTFYTCNHKGMFWTPISLDLNFGNSVYHMIDVPDAKVTLGFSVIKLPSMFNSSICTWTLNAVYQNISLVLSNSYSWHTFLQWLSEVIEFIHSLQPPTYHSNMPWFWLCLCRSKLCDSDENTRAALKRIYRTKPNIQECLMMAKVAANVHQQKFSTAMLLKNTNRLQHKTRYLGDTRNIQWRMHI